MMLSPYRDLSPKPEKYQKATGQVLIAQNNPKATGPEDPLRRSPAAEGVGDGSPGGGRRLGFCVTPGLAAPTYAIWGHEVVGGSKGRIETPAAADSAGRPSPGLFFVTLGLWDSGTAARGGGYAGNVGGVPGPDRILLAVWVPGVQDGRV